MSSLWKHISEEPRSALGERPKIFFKWAVQEEKEADIFVISATPVIGWRPHLQIADGLLEAYRNLNPGFFIFTAISDAW